MTESSDDLDRVSATNTDDSTDCDQTDRAESTVVSKRWGIRLLFICLATAAIVWGWNWYSDRPLVEIRQRLEIGDADRALRLLGFFLEGRPNHSVAMGLKGRALSATGRSDEAIELFNRFPPSDAAELFALARAHMDQSQWSLAIPFFSRTLELQPELYDALQGRCGCRVRLELFKEAAVDAELLAKHKGQEKIGYAWLGYANDQLGHYEKAIAAYEKALEHSEDGEGNDLPIPRSAFLENYARALFDSGRYDDALKILDRVTADRTEVACVLEADIRTKLGDTDGAIKAFKSAIELNIRSEEARVGLAKIALAKQDAVSAKELLTPVAPGTIVATAQTILDTLNMLKVDQTNGAKEAELKKTEQGIRAMTNHLADLKERELVYERVNHIMRTAPESFWGRAIVSYRMAQQGNFGEAVMILRELMSENNSNPFLQDLARAIQQRGVLPSLKLLPFSEIPGLPGLEIDLDALQSESRDDSAVETNPKQSKPDASATETSAPVLQKPESPVPVRN